MKTAFPYDLKIDLSQYLDVYLAQPDALRKIPGDEELNEIARKAIIREQLVLVSVPAGEEALAGDTCQLCTESKIARFNKPKVMVTLGREMYSKEL